MPRPRTQNDGVTLAGGCHACGLRANASKSNAKFSHRGCGTKNRTCTPRQFFHGCSGAIGISNDPMSVMTRGESLATPDEHAVLCCQHRAASEGGGQRSGMPRSDFGGSDSDEARSHEEPTEPDVAGRQHEAEPEDEGVVPPPTVEGDEDGEDDEDEPEEAPPPAAQPRLASGRFGARDTLDPQLLGSRYRVVG